MRKAGRALKRFGRAKRGVAAVEFGLVALPFFLLMFGLGEVSMVGFAQASLDYSVNETARRIRTGEAQVAGATYGDIQTSICTQLSQFIVLTCNGNLYIDVHHYPTFAAAASGQSNPIQNNQFDSSGFGYSPGNASDIVVVRAYYRWHVLTPLFQPIFQNISGGQRILVSTMMFRNEPYQ
ncbi:MAG: pilus assembly protein [Proteobacteria bacterium]|nr:pilus assembly protein [Pseudomonadota bacterium]